MQIFSNDFRLGTPRLEIVHKQGVESPELKQEQPTITVPIVIVSIAPEKKPRYKMVVDWFSNVGRKVRKWLSGLLEKW